MEERRIVTVLFCDVVSSTALASQLDPEDWAEIMEEVFPALIAPVEKYGGTVARLMGDAILAFFGAPQAHEDDPQRAILAGLDITRVIQPMRDRFARRYGLDFNVRVGINTGLVVMGEFGLGRAYEYTAMGDAINLASRMEQTAEPGTVQISQDTYRLVEHVVLAESLGGIEVKGKTEPVVAYRVLGMRSMPERHRGIAGTIARLSGRDEIVATLEQSIQELRAGRGQIISLIGEPGLGKSRLIDEMQRFWQSGNMAESSEAVQEIWLEDQALSYEAMEPYGVFRKRLADGFEIMPDDPIEVVRQKTLRSVHALGLSAPERAAALFETLLVARSEAGDGGGSVPPPATGAEFKRDLFTQMTDLFRRWNQGLTYVYVVDDVHWIDPASAELLVHLFQLTDQFPILFLCAYRPERETPAWMIKQAAETIFPHRYREIRLQPLSNDESVEILESAIIDLPSAPELEQLVLRLAVGNPLYIEEIIRSLIDQGCLVRDELDPHHRWRPVPGMNPTGTSIPETLHALLLNRIDSLDSETRNTLQRAAVIGLTFTRTILEAISDDPERLDGQLAMALRVELVRETAWLPEREFSFRHPLIWEVAYRSILRRQRRRYHRSVAETIERFYPDRLDEYAATLGHHYSQAEDERAIDWLLRAARQALGVHDARSAIEYSSQAINLSERLLPAVPEETLLIRGQAHETAGDYDEARRDFEQALLVARDSEHLELEWQALISLGMSWSEGDYNQTRNYYQQAYELANQIDERTIAHSLNRMGNWYLNADQPQEALAAHEKALAIFERIEDVAGIADTHDFLGIASFLACNPTSQAHHSQLAAQLFRSLGNQARYSSSLATLAAASGNYYTMTSPPVLELANSWRSRAEESLAIAREIASPSLIAFSNLVLGQLLITRGYYSRAVEAVEEMLEVATESGHRQWTIGANFALAVCKIDLFVFDQANTYIDRNLSQAQQIGSANWYNHGLMLRAEILAATGLYDQARSTLQAFHDPETVILSAAQRGCVFKLAELELLDGNPQRALEILDLLVRTAPGIGQDTVIPHLSYLRGLALKQLGCVDEAIAELEAARQAAGAFEFRPLFWRVELALGDAWLSKENAEAANQAFAHARDTVQKLAAEIPDPAIQATFTSEVNARFPTGS